MIIVTLPIITSHYIDTFAKCNMTHKIQLREYRSTDRMRDIIADNSMLLSALSRFEISLGFGDASIRDVCSRTNVDTDTFLAVVNLISGKPFSAYKIDVKSLILYLRNAHTYFLDYLLPQIRRRLIDAISNTTKNDVPLLILKFFDDYQDEVYKHMSYENNHVFSYVQKLIDGTQPDDYNIANFIANHKPIASKLHELKEIIICHYNGDGNRVDLINSVLFDIIMCEHDLLRHCEVEDRIFVPAVLELENKVTHCDVDQDTGDDSITDVAISNLTDREKEIIACIARGMSNKEIADRLFLSVHTVATHRRNICSKLEIHSTSGLTIFAIIHNLIDLSDLNQ